MTRDFSHAFFLFGLPTETKEEAILTLEFAEELDKLNFPFIFFSRYYEGTEMYNLALKNGFSKELMNDNSHAFYHEIDSYHTPTLSCEDVEYIKNYFLYKILFNEKRIRNMLEVQKKFFKASEIVDFINSMFKVNIDTIEEFEKYVIELNQSRYIKKYFSLL